MSGNALIRVEIENSLGSRRHLDWWDDAMEGEFATTDISQFSEVQAAYDELSECFRRDLYIIRENPPDDYSLDTSRGPRLVTDRGRRS